MSENQIPETCSISDDQIREILMHHDKILQENEQQIDLLKKQIEQMYAEHIPEEWIVSESFSGSPVCEVHTAGMSNGNDFSRLMAKYEAYQKRRMDAKLKQTEAKMRYIETVCRVMCAYDVLPARLQDVLRIIYLECGSYTVGIREAAQKLEVSTSTADRRRREGMQTIRRICESGLSTSEIIALTPDEVQKQFGRQRKK